MYASVVVYVIEVSLRLCSMQTSAGKKRPRQPILDSDSEVYLL